MATSVDRDKETGMSYYTTGPANNLSNCGEPNKEQTNTQQFDAQIQTVTQERGVIYGEPHVNFNRMADIDFIVADCQDRAIRSALRMIGYKLCRLVQSPEHLDSVIDIAGYARIIAMLQDTKLGNPRKE